MVRYDEDLPFFVNLKDYDSSESIKMRVIATNDWGTINWKTGDLIDPNCECVHLPVALLYVHGGGFLSGSSSSYQPVLRRFARETGYPVFAVDYRLAPENRFPIPLSDSFLAYLWLRYYSEKYMKVKFDKIILMGDSAGSWISFSLWSLAIRKKLIKPDGNVWLYPGFCCDRTRFTPSLLISIDEIYVNTLFIDHCLTSYVDSHSVTANYLWTPSHTPKKILKHMPPTRMGIAGIDPLRDSGIELFRDWVKAGVNCKGKVYKHFFHGYLEMDEYPFKLLDCKQGFNDALEFINDIVDLDDH
jgi:acetyl esterase